MYSSRLVFNFSTLAIRGELIASVIALSNRFSPLAFDTDTKKETSFTLSSHMCYTALPPPPSPITLIIFSDLSSIGKLKGAVLPLSFNSVIYLLNNQLSQPFQVSISLYHIFSATKLQKIQSARLATYPLLSQQRFACFKIQIRLHLKRYLCHTNGQSYAFYNVWKCV